jgi:hypothetical protein
MDGQVLGPSLMIVNITVIFLYNVILRLSMNFLKNELMA